jgi:type IV pilus assembly protein PilW
MIFKMSHSNKTQNLLGANRVGFTLIELMVAIAIGSIVMLAVYSVYTGLMRSYTTQNVAADVQQNVRAGIDYMTEDIMMAGLDPNKSSGASFEAASSTNLRFTLDRNLNGAIDNTDSERITFAYDAANRRLNQCLYEGTGSDDWELFFDDVQNMAFNYVLDDGSAPTADPVPGDELDRIRMVIVTLTIEAPAGLGGTVDRTYTTRIRCRNIGL